MNTQELIAILENSFGKSATIMNSAMRKTFKYSKEMFNDSDEDKIRKVLPLLDSKHIYVKYWGAIIALSYKILEERAIKELITILDMNPKEYDKPLDLNMLKINAGTYLYAYRKIGFIGSFPGHNPSKKDYCLPNYNGVVRYYKRKYKIRRQRNKTS